MRVELNHSALIKFEALKHILKQNNRTRNAANF